MDDADRVHRGHGLEQAHRQLGQTRSGQRAVAADHGVQRLARHVAHDDVGQLRVEVGVEDLGHPGVAHPQQRADLAGQAGAGLGVRGHVGAHDLDRHGAVGAVEAQVHDPHAALADDAQQAVAPDGPPLRHLRLTVPTVRRARLGTVGPWTRGRSSARG